MTIVRERGRGLDVNGDPIAGVPDTEDLPGAFIAPTQSSNIDGRGRAGEVVGLALFGPIGTDVQHGDIVRVGDTDRYRVEGERADWINPMSGWKAGIQIAVRRTKG